MLQHCQFFLFLVIPTLLLRFFIFLVFILQTPQCKVEYLDIPEGSEEPAETNWIKRAGKCKVTYPNGCIFEGMLL